MSHRHVAVTALILFACSLTALAAEEQWLTYRWSREPWRSGVSISPMEVEVLGQAPDGVPLPKLSASDARIGKWLSPMVKAGGIYFAVDRSDPKGPYDTLYIDSNCDGALTDERGIKAFAADGNSARFGPVKVVFPTPEGPVGHHVNIASYNYPNYNNFRVSSAGWYEGEITIGGEGYDCRLVDYNSNGAFDDTSMDFSQADRICIGKNGNYETFFAGKYLGIDEKFHHPEPARDGAFIVMTPLENVPMGTVKVPEGVDELAVGGENGFAILKITDGAAAVPAGKWRISHWSMSKKDEQGATWTLRGAGFGGDKGLFEATEAEAVILDVGEPVVAALNSSKNGALHNFGEALRGHAGESVSIERNGQRPPAPRLRVTNEDGSYNRLYSFEYG